MYQPSRQLASFHVAGFKYWDGALVLDRLKPGTPLSLAPERDNPYDPNAIALYYGEAKLGYVPRTENAELSTLCFFGHASIFECRVLQADPEETPWKQVLVGIYVRDGRKPASEPGARDSNPTDPNLGGAIPHITVTVEPMDER